MYKPKKEYMKKYCRGNWAYDCFNSIASSQMARRRCRLGKNKNILVNKEFVMNAERRKRLTDAIAYINKAVQIIEDVRDDEQDSFDNLPESIQSGDRGMLMEECIQGMDEVLEGLDSCISDIEDVKNAK